MTKPIDITVANYVQEVEQSPIPVIVDFWAPWCSACRSLSPTINALAKEYDGKVKICKINVDDNPGVSDFIDLGGLPTMVFYQNGTPVQTLVGAYPKAELVKFLDEKGIKPAVNNPALKFSGQMATLYSQRAPLFSR
jgi:thioredoxin